jgi:predicted DNA-binding transcriptional regulator AlpA
VRVNVDDLLDANEVAELLGLSSNSSVSTYRARYDDFPAPIVQKSSKKCVLWLRPDIERWAAHRAKLLHRAGT